MEKREGNITKKNDRKRKTIWGSKVKKKIKKVFAMSMAVMLTGNMTALSVLAVPDVEEENTIIYESEWEPIPELQTAAISANFFSLSDGKVPLTEYGETWFERLDLSEDRMFDDFYNILIEASDNDGSNDFLIEDQYFDGTAEENAFFGKNGDGSTYIIIGKTTCDSEQELQTILDRYSPYIFAVTQAFDRDYPDVFWLSGRGSTSYTVETDSNGNKTVTFRYLLKNDKIDIRNEDYRNETSIKNAIKQRDSKIDEIISEVSGKSSEEKIKYFNKILTENNEYNTSSDLNTIAADCRKCISALEGRTGQNGPVCEGYARAFKVLCDKVNIPCVLVNGISRTGAHMWNNVQLGNHWYGVDITWNDPMGGAAGAVSGVENEDYLLVGAGTIIEDEAFEDSHIVENRVSDGGVEFVNGPQLHNIRYSEVIPEETESNKPEETESNKPEETESNKPEETESNKPEETESNKPEETESNKPEETESGEPEETESNKPEETESNKPEETESSEPEETESNKPEETESGEPEETESNKPEETESSEPEETESNKPEETESSIPEESTTPEETTSERETIWDDDDDDDDDDDSDRYTSFNTNSTSDLPEKPGTTIINTTANNGAIVQVTITKSVSSFAPKNSIIPAPVSKDDIIDYSSKKGFTSTIRGVVTGEGSGYSKWKKDKKGWWIEFADGSYAAANSSKSVQWEMINGSWYCFGNDGYAEENWIFDTTTNGWYFIDIQKGMQTGWKQIGNKWYYLNPISNGTKGKMLTNIWIDGYYINKDGEWENNK